MGKLKEIKDLKHFELNKNVLKKVYGGTLPPGWCNVLTKYNGNPELQDDPVRDAPQAQNF